METTLSAVQIYLPTGFSELYEIGKVSESSAGRGKTVMGIQWLNDKTAPYVVVRFKDQTLEFVGMPFRVIGIISKKKLT